MTIVELDNESFRVRSLSQRDLSEIPIFVRACPPLSVHGAWFYAMFCNFQKSLCHLVELVETPAKGSTLVGLILAMTTDDDDTIWVQQIGVSERLRGRRTNNGSTLGELLWDALAASAVQQNRPKIVCSIEESNQRSMRLLEKFAIRHETTVERVNGVVLPEDELVLSVTLP